MVTILLVKSVSVVLDVVISIFSVATSVFSVVTSVFSVVTSLSSVVRDDMLVVAAADCCYKVVI
jgi:phage-related protein